MKACQMKTWQITATLLAVLATLGGEALARDAARDMIYRVQILTAPVLAGRGSGTSELQAAADSLASWLAASGLEPAFAGSWFQPFELQGEGWAGNKLSGLQDRNVAGIIRGAGDLASRYVVVAAHYDHLGRVVPVAGGGPLPGPQEYYPGANDNASGVAVVTEIIELLSALETEDSGRRSVMVVFFGAEEVGLQGSRYFVAHPPLDLAIVDAMVNFDTVGQIVDDRLYVSGVGTAQPLRSLAVAANSEDLQLTLGDGGWSGSDHMSFNEHKVPVVFIFGGPYPQYNRPGDTWDELTPRGLVQVANYGSRLIDGIRKYPSDLTWISVAVKNERQGDTSAENRTTWFGSLPDFTVEVKGYKLGGVFAGSPAAKAGLQKGDVLVKIAGGEVVDLASFTHELRSHDPGDLVEVLVLRAGNQLSFTVVLGDRSSRK